jgi:7 transmembrane sweet-taste receptor of 3 GCPR/Concanavalin A-like lectin/glucanases superfamily/IPT/TIG domain
MKIFFVFTLCCVLFLCARVDGATLERLERTCASVGDNEQLLVVVGTGFSQKSSVRCVFGSLGAFDGVILDDTHVQCTAPSSNGEVASHHFSLQFAANDVLDSKQLFFYYEPSSIASMTPELGPLEGGTVVRMAGELLLDGWAIACEFNAQRVQATAAATTKWPPTYDYVCTSPEVAELETHEETLSVVAEPFIMGNALHFDGLGDRAIIPPIDGTLGDITLELWIKFDSTLVGRAAVLEGCQAGESIQTNCHFWIEMNPGTVDGMATVSLGHEYALGSNQEVVFDDVAPTGRWFHFAMTRAQKKYTIYVDGELVDSAPYTVEPEADPQPGLVGSWAGASFVMGSLDEIRIWVVARSAEEIKENFRRRLVGNDAGLRALFDFEDRDSSSSASSLMTSDDRSQSMEMTFGTDILGGIVNEDNVPFRHAIIEAADALPANTQPSSPFTYYSRSSIDSLAPPSGPLSGGTAVDVHGAGFVDSGDSLVCEFGGEVPTLLQATFVSESLVRCVSLQADCNLDDLADLATTYSNGSSALIPVSVRVSNNGGQDFTNSDTFAYYSQPKVFSLEPDIGDVVGGELITLFGTGFHSAPELSVRFGQALSPHSELSDQVFVDASGQSLQMIVATSPEHVDAVVPVEASLNGQQFTSDTRLFLYESVEYLWPEWSDAEVIFIVVIAAIAIVGIVVLGVLYLLKVSPHRIVFVLSVMLGSAMACVMPFTAVGEPSTSQCSAEIWIGGIGAALIVYAIAARMVFVTKKLATDDGNMWNGTGDPAPELLVAAIVAVGVVAQCVVLAIWQAVETPEAEQHTNSSMNRNEVAIRCSTVDQISFLVPFFIVLGAPLIFSAIIAVITRHVRGHQSSHRILSLAAINALLMLVIVIAPALIVEDEPEPVYMMRYLFILFAAISTFLILLIPPIWMALGLYKST